MSNETISPAAFYSKRNFGYKRFEKVPLNNLNNKILLYGRYPLFELDSTFIENYPLVLEIDTSTLNQEINIETEDIYSCVQTIYLNPFTTKIIFRDIREKKSTISKAEPAIETKLLPLYYNTLTSLEEENSFQKFEYKIYNFDDSNNDIQKFLENDIKINKIKGFLYSYLIASNKIVDIIYIKLLKNVKELKNLLSAIIQSPEKAPVGHQNDELNKLYNSINTILISLNKKSEIDKKIKELKKKYKGNIEEFLKNENLWEFWINKNFSSNNSYFETFQFYKNDKIDLYFNQYCRKLDNIIANVKEKIMVSNSPKKKTKKLHPEYLPEILDFKIKNFKDEEDPELLMKLLNEFLDVNYNSEKFLNSKYEFALIGGKVIKQYLLDKREEWENSKEQNYINSLLTNLNQGSNFDINSIDNKVLKSFAAFCQKGDKVIDLLEDYLISKEIHNFKIAFSFWGIVFGFADLPKTFFYEIYSYNVEYIKLIYEVIYEKVFNSKITKFSKNEIKIDYFTFNKKRNDNYEENESIYGDLFASDPTINKTSNTNKEKEDERLEFYKDVNAWEKVKQYIPKEYHENIKEEIKWIQKVHTEGGYRKKDGSYVTLDNHSNSEVIIHLENNIKSKKNKKSKTADIPDHVLATLINKLKEIYK
jgi:hypothetical protein